MLDYDDVINDLYQIQEERARLYTALEKIANKENWKGMEVDSSHSFAYNVGLTPWDLAQKALKNAPP